MGFLGLKFFNWSRILPLLIGRLLALKRVGEVGLCSFLEDGFLLIFIYHVLICQLGKGSPDQLSDKQVVVLFSLVV